MPIEILIVEDEADIRTLIASVLRDEGYATREAINSKQALQSIEDKKPGIIILDIWLNNSELDGIQILERIKKLYSSLPVIIISGHATVDMAVSATKKGAFDFLSKPFKIEALLNAITRALSDMRLRAENLDLQTRLGVGDLDLIGECKEIRLVRKNIKEMSTPIYPVAIFGATGTGKAVVARDIHKQSNRAGVFISIDCGLSDFDLNITLFGLNSPRKSGAFEEASAGTIVIDNVECSSNHIQEKIARCLSKKQIITSDNKKTIPFSAKVIITSKFPEKISRVLLDKVVNQINIPTLNERISDMTILCKTFMMYRARAKGMLQLKFSQSSLITLASHNWVANLWELINVIDRLLLNVKGSIITSEDVASALWHGEVDKTYSMDKVLMQSLRRAREDFEKYYLAFHLRRLDGSITRTAQYIAMDRAALSRKLKLLKIVK